MSVSNSEEYRVPVRLFTLAFKGTLISRNWLCILAGCLLLTFAATSTSRQGTRASPYSFGLIALDPFEREFRPYRLNDIPLSVSTAERALLAFGQYKALYGTDIRNGLILEELPCWRVALNPKAQTRHTSVICGEGNSADKARLRTRTVAQRLGFENASRWSEVMRSLVAAYKYGVLGKRNRAQELAVSVWEEQLYGPENNLSDERRTMLERYYEAVLPIPANIAVARILARNPKWVRLLTAISRH